MSYKLPIVLLTIILLVVAFGAFIPTEIKQILYTLSLNIKSVIIFLLPLIIFGLLFKTIIHLTHNATRIIFFILGGVICSNFIATFLSHYVGSWIYHLNLSIVLPKESSSLAAAWTFSLPHLISNDKAMFAGIGLGIFLNLIKIRDAEKVADK